MKNKEDNLQSNDETNYLNQIPDMANSIIVGALEPLSECIKYEEDEEW